MAGEGLHGPGCGPIVAEAYGRNNPNNDASGDGEAMRYGAVVVL